MKKLQKMNDEENNINETSKYIVKLILDKVNNIHSTNIKISYDNLESIDNLKFTDEIKIIEDELKNNRCITVKNKEIVYNVAKELSKNTLDNYEWWYDVFDILSDYWYELCEIWVNNIDIASIDKNIIKDIKKVNRDSPLTMLVKICRFQDEVCLERGAYMKKNSHDEWEYILELNENVQYLLLGNELRLKNKLLKRSSDDVWLSWISKLPLNEIKILCVNTIISIDKLEDLIIKLASRNSIDKELVCIFLQHYMDIYEKEYENILRKNDEYEDEHKEKFENLISKLIELNKTDINDIVIYILKYIVINRRENKIKSNIRSALVKVMLNSDIDISYIVKKILKNNINTSALVSSMLFFYDNEVNVNECDYPKDEIFKSYKSLLDDDYNIKLIPFDINLDDCLCTWLFAGIISLYNKPLDMIKELLSTKILKSEGWNFKYRKYYKSIGKVSNICILSAMTSEWILFKDKEDKEAKNIFMYTWDFVHKYIRNISIYNENIEATIVQLWARLPIIYNNEFEIQDIVLKTIKNIDNIKYIILGMRLLQENLNDNTFKFNNDICQFLNKKYEMDYPIIINKYAIKDSEIDWYDKNIKYLDINSVN